MLALWQLLWSIGFLYSSETISSRGAYRWGLGTWSWGQLLPHSPTHSKSIQVDVAGLPGFTSSGWPISGSPISKSREGLGLLMTSKLLASSLSSMSSDTSWFLSCCSNCTNSFMLNCLHSAVIWEWPASSFYSAFWSVGRSTWNRRNGFIKNDFILSF